MRKVGRYEVSERFANGQGDLETKLLAIFPPHERELAFRIRDMMPPEHVGGRMVVIAWTETSPGAWSGQEED